MSNTPMLKTERLILRRFEEKDVQALFDILRDEEVNTFLPWFPCASLQQAQQELRHKYQQYYERPSGYRYAVCLQQDNVPIGYVHVGDDDSHDLGYGLRKEFWHKGITTEAAKAVMAQLKKDGCAYITATHDVQNPHSGDVMKKLGMTYRYSYEEQWQPKDRLVTFRLYQLNFDGSEWTYQKYWQQSSVHFVEPNL